MVDARDVHGHEKNEGKSEAKWCFRWPAGTLTDTGVECAISASVTEAWPPVCGAASRRATPECPPEHDRRAPTAPRRSLNYPAYAGMTLANGHPTP